MEVAGQGWTDASQTQGGSFRHSDGWMDGWMIVEMETWHEMDIYVLCMLARYSLVCYECSMHGTDLPVTACVGVQFKHQQRERQFA